MAPWGSDDEDSNGYGSDVELMPSGEEQVSERSKVEFFNILDSIETFGDFACMTRYPQHINPGLEVEGSLIPLPLVDRDADMIKSKCEQAPFGRGDDTVVDESVRKTWQLDAGHFHCSNPAWPSFLQSVVHETAQKLGMPNDIRAVPWKLLLYEEGSFFRPHKDSEKEPGMVGTLVMSLPSKHEGGQVHLSLGHMRHAFATSNFSGFELTALAWYSDVTHEVKPLTGGYRLVMTYNLLQQSGCAPSGGMFANQKQELQALLWLWLHPDPAKAKIICRLEHKYSRSTLAIKYMKGRDAQISRCLQHVCQESGYHLFLAVMTRTQSQEDDYYGEEGDDSVQLDYVTDVDGNLIAENIDVDVSQILGPDPYENRDADSEDEGEFTGNESTPSEFRYHDSALLIVPTSGLTHFIKSPHCSVADLIRMVCLPSADPEDEPPTQREVVYFLNSVLENYGSSIVEARLLKMIFRACKMWSSNALYHKAMRRAVMEAQSKTRLHPTSQSLMPGSPMTEIAEALAEHCTQYIPHPTEQEWNACLGELVHGLEASLVNEALMLIEKRLNREELIQSFRGWRSSVETSKFEAADRLTTLDLHLVLDLIQSHSGDDVWVSTVLLPKLSERAEKQLLYALLHVLCKQAEDGQFPLQHQPSLARRVLDATFSKLSLEIGDVEIETARQLPGPRYIGGSSAATNRALSNVTAFVGLLENCFMCHLKELGLELLSNSHKNLRDGISRLAPREPARQYTIGLRHHGAPNLLERPPAEEFLASLVIILQRHLSLNPPPYVKDLFILLFTRYVLPDQPNNPPQRPDGWSHKPRFCSRHNPGNTSHGNMHGNLCYECQLMQDFIRAPDQAVGRFTYAKNIRSHLEGVLPRQHYRCATDTTKLPGTNCQTLVVTKIGADTEFVEDMKGFSDKMRVYEKRLLIFRQPIVRGLLGEEAYKSLILMEAVPLAMPNASTSIKRCAAESPDQPASTRQRTDGVIDLTDE